MGHAMPSNTVDSECQHSTLPMAVPRHVSCVLRWAVCCATQALGTKQPMELDEDDMVERSPNRGILLIGDERPESSGPELRLPFGRKLKVPTISVADGNVLCWAG